MGASEASMYPAPFRRLSITTLIVLVTLRIWFKILKGLTWRNYFCSLGSDITDSHLIHLNLKLLAWCIPCRFIDLVRSLLLLTGGDFQLFTTIFLCDRTVLSMLGVESRTRWVFLTLTLILYLFFLNKLRLKLIEIMLTTWACGLRGWRYGIK